MEQIKAADVARYVLLSVDEDSGDNISNLKLQKLVYYAQGFHLAVTGRPLFDDPILAWTHGPVVSSLYHAFSQYKAGAIPRPEDDDVSMFSGDPKDVMDEVLKVYGQFSAWKLRDMTHAEPPWKDTAPNGIIPHDSMKEYL